MSDITPERIAELRRLLAARAHPCASQDQVYAVVNAAVASMPYLLDEVERLRARAESAEKRLAALVHECGDVIEIPSLRRVFPVVHALLERAIAAAKGEA